jgi:hypothetical protein
MRLVLTRDVFASDWTLGRLDIEYDGALQFGPRGWSPVASRTPLPFGFVCEDEDRGLDAAMSLAEIARLKVWAETAIPTGLYRVARTWSPKYERPVMQLLGVPGFSGIRIHPGNHERHTAGCPLPGLGRDTQAGTVSQSTVATDWLNARVQECEARGEAVSIVVQRDPSAWAATDRAITPSVTR